MPETSWAARSSAQFEAAANSVRHASLRPELSVSEIPAPTDLAPHSVALAGEVLPPSSAGTLSHLGTGRLVLLHNSDEPEAWGSPFRIVCIAKAPLEADIAADPLFADVAWSWLIDALTHGGAAFSRASGTVTTVMSSGFGELSQETDGVQIELRASWSPTESNVSAHVESWGQLLCLLAGLPPVAEGVATLAGRRGFRG
jgi:hypothetical protein